MHMDIIDWINQITSWLLLIDAGVFLCWMMRAGSRR